MKHRHPATYLLCNEKTTPCLWNHYSTLFHDDFQALLSVLGGGFNPFYPEHQKTLGIPLAALGTNSPRVYFILLGEIPSGELGVFSRVFLGSCGFLQKRVKPAVCGFLGCLSDLGWLRRWCDWSCVSYHH